MNFQIWLTFATAYFVATISPGPNVLLVIRNSLSYGYPSALVTILGNLTSQLMIVLLVACGVGAAIAALPQFFFIMKIVGASYLIFLGIKQIHSTRKSPLTINNEASIPRMSMSKMGIFREAFLVSSSNPKTLIFLSAFMPQFVNQSGSLAEQFIIMFLTISASVICVHTFYSISIGRLKHTIKNSRFVKWIKYMGGSLFVVLGVKLLTSA